MYNSDLFRQHVIPSIRKPTRKSEPNITRKFWNQSIPEILEPVNCPQQDIGKHQADVADVSPHHRRAFPPRYSPNPQNPKPETRNTEPETRNSKPKTRNLELKTHHPSNPKPYTRSPSPKAGSARLSTHNRRAFPPAAREPCFFLCFISLRNRERS